MRQEAFKRIYLFKNITNDIKFPGDVKQKSNLEAKVCRKKQ